MSAPPPEPDPPEYAPENFRFLTGHQHVRMRPGMYIGDTAVAGLHQLLLVLLDVAFNEHIAGRCQEVCVWLLPDNGCRVRFDSARPLCLVAIERLPQYFEAIPGRTELFPLLSTSLVGISLQVTNALSERFEIEVIHGRELRRQRFQRGEADGEAERESTAEPEATTISFWPDPEIFRANPNFHWATLWNRFLEVSFLLPRLTIQFTDQRLKRHRNRTDHSPGGLLDFLRHASTLRKDRAVHPNAFFAEGAHEEIRWQVALQWHAGKVGQIRAFANLAETIWGGTHVDGLRRALSQVLKQHSQNYGLLNDTDWRDEDCLSGLLAIVAVMLPEPHYEGASRNKLNNPEVASVIEASVIREFTLFLEANPNDACAIVQRVIQACQAREAASVVPKRTRGNRRHTP